MRFLAQLDLREVFDWVQRHLGPIFIAVVFFVLPIVRGLMEQAKKKKQILERETPPPARDDEEPDGRKAWEALMRGEEPVSKPPPLVEPPIMMRTVTPPPIKRAVEGSEVHPTLTGRLSDFPSAPTENEEEGSLDEESLARELNDRMLREEMQRRSDFLSRERENAARKEIAPESLVSIEARETEKAVVIDRSALGALFTQGVDRRVALRRAMIAREVLGPPLALRTHVDALGPTALSP